MVATMAGGSGNSTEPYMAFQFVVAVGSQNGTEVIGGFSDVTGLGAETEVETLRVGGLNTTEVMLPGPTKFPSRLVLKRGVAHPARLWGWYQKIMGGRITRENVTIMIPSARGERGPQWVFSQACPVKWTGPELHAGTSAIAFETIELVHKGFVPGT